MLALGVENMHEYPAFLKVFLALFYVAYGVFQLVVLN